MFSKRKCIVFNFFLILVIVFTGCTTHNYYSSEQPKRSMKEMVECVVSYIATREEKAQLKPLNSDAELNSFLIEFWKKRDPSPETEINEYRDTYLERFQIANVSLGGWQTDRGRVFILYGKPEDIILSEDKEIWIYPDKERIPNYDHASNVPEVLESGKIKFYFHDSMGIGVMQQIYSTEFGENR